MKGAESVESLMRPVIACAADAPLGQVWRELSAGEAVAVQMQDGWYALLPQAAVGHALSRLLVDLPLQQVAEMSADTAATDALAMLEQEERTLGLVFRNGRPCGCVTRQDLLRVVLDAALSVQRYEEELRELNASLEERVRERTFELEVLYEMAQQLTTALNYDDLFAEVVRRLRPIMRHDAAATLLFTEDVRELRIYPRRPLSDAAESELKSRLLAAYEQAAGETVDCEKLTFDGVEPGWDEEKGDLVERLLSVFAAPLSIGPDRQIVGVMLVAAERPDAFSEEQTRLLRTVIGQASVSVERLRSLVAAQRRRLGTLVENLPYGVVLATGEGLCLVHNRRAADYLRLLGEWRPGEPLTRIGDASFAEVKALQGKDSLEVNIGEGEERRVFEIASFPAEPLEDGAPTLVIVVQDVTRAREMAAQAAAQDRLAAVGQLAGGIAHDFNNLLTVILGSADFAMEALAENDPRRADLEQIQEAARRAVTLTRQLLAFSRRQVLKPELVSLNLLISDMEKMLRRLIGENIDLQTRLAEDLWAVEADPGQIEQVVMNLVVNARDAMPKGGRLIIETVNAELGEDYASRHLGVTPGRYVMVAVSDTGMGMDEQTRRRAFEPFFTTKKDGKGTGLGLATVYGIVKQSGGAIDIHSEPGKGATFKVYLPACDACAASVSRKEKITDASALRGVETILVVEDEETLRRLTRRALELQGYQVLSAANGEEALLEAERHDGDIHLLLADLVMPGLDGGQVFDELARRQPGLKVLYMSGYSDSTIVNRGFLRAGSEFLRKPFTLSALALKVREVLDAGKE